MLAPSFSFFSFQKTSLQSEDAKKRYSLCDLKKREFIYFACKTLSSLVNKRSFFWRTLSSSLHVQKNEKKNKAICGEERGLWNLLTLILLNKNGFWKKWSWKFLKREKLVLDFWMKKVIEKNGVRKIDGSLKEKK